MTTETIEVKKVPGTPDRALVKAADLSNASIRISWALNEDGKKVTQALFLRNQFECVGDDNTRLISAFMNTIEQLQLKNEELQSKLEGLESE